LRNSRELHPAILAYTRCRLQRLICVAISSATTDFSGGPVRDNPAVNKRVAEAAALGRAGVPDDIGHVPGFGILGGRAGYT